MKSWMKDIARFVPGIGLIVLGPVWTMIMSPEKLGASYAFGVIDGLLVAFATTSLYEELLIILKRRDVAGSSQ